jgi:hypothetical protein
MTQLEVAGLALAAPAVVDMIVNSSRLVYRTVNNFRTIDEVMAR